MSNKKNNSNSNVSAKGGENNSGTKKPGDAIQAKPLQVVVGNRNNFDKAFKAFRALVQKDRILSLYREKGVFEKPSTKKRRKRNAAARERLSQENKK